MLATAFGIDVCFFESQSCILTTRTTVVDSLPAANINVES